MVTQSRGVRYTLHKALIGECKQDVSTILPSLRGAYVLSCAHENVQSSNKDTADKTSERWVGWKDGGMDG